VAATVTCSQNSLMVIPLGSWRGQPVSRRPGADDGAQGNNRLALGRGRHREMAGDRGQAQVAPPELGGPSGQRRLQAALLAFAADQHAVQLAG
jgi:hypothetical protein